MRIINGRKGSRCILSLLAMLIMGSHVQAEGEMERLAVPIDRAVINAPAKLQHLQNPIVLVDGFFRRSKVRSEVGMRLLATFRNVENTLRRHGAQVFLNNRDAFGTIEHNAELLARDIDHALAVSGKDKVHIIAHSKGGIDARYMITHLGYGDRVATLVTIATPHRGTVLAELFLEYLGPASEAAEEVVNSFANVIGDSQPQSKEVLQQMTRESMARFNEETPDDPRVRYISYAGRIDWRYLDPVYAQMSQLIASYEGPNDGVVSVSSAKWGEFGGVVNEIYDRTQVNHGDMVGDNELWNNMGFPFRRFFIDIALQLE